VLTAAGARRASEIFWPAFVEHVGVIFLASTSLEMRSLPLGQSRTEQERLQGHTHIQDVFRWTVPMRYDADMDENAPDPDAPEHAAA
jgi:hypothetical protein